MLSLPSSLSFSSSTSTTTNFLSPHHHHHLRLPHHSPTTLITASSTPPTSFPNLIIPKDSNTAQPQPQNLYQPYRPPQSPLPAQYRNLDTLSIIDILANRLGLWHEYAPLISSLFRDGFTHPSIEELTGITGVEQNRLVVAAQVRESIVDSPAMGPEILSFFDAGGSEILYELRLLNTDQRAAAANYVVTNRLDGEKARDIARAIKDFPSRQLVPGFDKFDYNKPGDCWAFTFFRQSREFTGSPENRMTALETALKVAETDMAKKAIKEEMEVKGGVEEEKERADGVRVPVVRLKYGEVAEATSVVVLPVCKAEEKEKGIMSAPFECRSEGEFGVVVGDKGWNRWVVLPKWIPVAGMGVGGVGVVFPDCRPLPWRTSQVREPILVVVERGRTEVVSDDGFYLVMEGGGLKVSRGLTLKEKGVSQSLGIVVIVVRPPRDEDEDQLNDEDWD